ncbi:oxidoreductase domain-containing protein [Coniochaeta sp. 2T2.1]|nr:oxidoreductase domain-containing protein [Coniochaeta sp. 2T2.1]
MFNSVLAHLKGGRSPSQPTKRSPLKPGKPIQTNYASNPVPIPDTFLTTPPPDAAPLTISQIDFAASVLPEYAGCHAIVLDNVLSPSECRTLLDLAEASVPGAEENGEDPWRPALVNVGGGYEVLQPEYRNSDRIIWDRQVVVDRLWERCLAAPGLKEKLGVVEQDVVVLAPSRSGRAQRWEFRRLNDRMRFLRYGKGQFFRTHCDAPYREPGKDIKTLFTLHLYLNDSKQTVGDEAELEGGATSFYSGDEKRKMDVDPKAGRVLIFQHRNLYHSGDEVVSGIKYTMRTDIMYEMVPVREDTAVKEAGEEKK